MEGQSISELEMAGRLLLALALCAAIGFERESRGQVAGLRTHILVGMGSALFTILSAYAFNGFIEANPAGGPLVTVDPTRIAAQIIAGIGFLGAGAIITQGITVRGLTTAAALWIAAAIGMACGIGFYFGAIFTTGVVIFSLVGVRYLRPLYIHRLRSEIVVLEVSFKKQKKLRKIFVFLAGQGATVQTMKADVENRVRFELLLPGDCDEMDFEARLNQIKGVRVLSMRSARADAFFDSA